jgi:hypothetical protein
MIALLLIACAGTIVDPLAPTCVTVMSSDAGMLLIDGEPAGLLLPYQSVDACVYDGQAIGFDPWPEAGPS